MRAFRLLKWKGSGKWMVAAGISNSLRGIRTRFIPDTWAHAILKHFRYAGETRDADGWDAKVNVVRSD